jgi:hypothetical protein
MQVLLILHNLFRWLILLFAFWTLLSALSGLSGKKEYTAGDGRSNFFFMLSMDIQLLIGLILYFSGAWFERLKHLGENMKDPMLRYCMDFSTCWKNIGKESYNSNCKI